jgi:Fe-S cluster biosynthesis and repair protein YggX
MKEKDFQKYPKWLKDEAHREYVLRAMERIWNHKARVVINNERLFMIDWQGKNSVTVDEMHYILDKERGVFTLYGDWGEAVAYFSHRVEVEDLLSCLRMCSYDYFVEKIVTRSPYDFDYVLGDQEIEKRVSKVYLWVLCFFMACEDAGLRESND